MLVAGSLHTRQIQTMRKAGKGDGRGAVSLYMVLSKTIKEEYTLCRVFLPILIMKWIVSELAVYSFASFTVDAKQGATHPLPS